eukprot:GDKI01006579.1.p1 GENE.GDKI01006579.1~~GDKI01006579.1.p1  ORF type:complete len:371 (+),score=127.93 GDKI01006579.1:57-1115(+)
MPVETVGYAALKAKEALQPWSFHHKDVGPKDVHIRITYSGICHSDIHQAREEWGPAIFPMVPGHEIAGIVEAVGSEVTKVKKGDKVGVGCMVGSCRHCSSCDQHLEQFCDKGMIGTYNGRYPDGTPTYGGYARDIVVDEHFTLKWPENLDQCAGAPLLCAGVTTYSPIMHHGMGKPGNKVGVVGLGGLGHMAVKFLVAMGAEAIVISRSDNKKQEALETLKAKGFINSSDPAAMQAAAGSLDFIIDTVSGDHPIDPLVNLLKLDGTLVFVGASPDALKFAAFGLIMRRRKVAGSLIGGIKETQEMLDFCGKHNITCMVEKIKAEDINTAYERMGKSDVRYRFVIDAETFPKA